MGRLAGFSYREVIRCLRSFGFEFDRQGPGSHEIWRHSQTGRKVTNAAPHRRYGGRDTAGGSPRGGNRYWHFPQDIAGRFLPRTVGAPAKRMSKKGLDKQTPLGGLCNGFLSSRISVQRQKISISPCVRAGGAAWSTTPQKKPLRSLPKDLKRIIATETGDE